jgi:surfeit locus 1 family protein
MDVKKRVPHGGSSAWLAVVVLVAALAGVSLTARLGFWQLDRAAQKIALQRALDERAAWPVLQQDELPSSEAQALGQHHRRVQLRGTWVPAATVFLDNRQMNGRPGFFVVTPLLLQPPPPPASAAARAVLVQRGWVPRDAAERARLPQVPTPEGPVEIKGLMAPPPGRLFEFAASASASGPIRQNLDLPAFAAETRLPLQPYSVVQMEAGSALDDGLLRQWPRPAVDVHRHHGYAFQWFSLAALLAGLYLWFQILSPLVRARRRTAARPLDEI